MAGNPIKNPGLNYLIEALFKNINIEELNINNILFGDNKETVDNLVNLMTSHPTLINYEVKYNLYTNTGMDS